jgi:hypothetical protein
MMAEDRVLEDSVLKHRGTEAQRGKGRGEDGGEGGGGKKRGGRGRGVFVLARAGARASMISDGQRTLVTKFYEEPRYWESVLVIRVRNPYK